VWWRGGTSCCSLYRTGSRSERPNPFGARPSLRWKSEKLEPRPEFVDQNPDCETYEDANDHPDGETGQKGDQRVTARASCNPVPELAIEKQVAELEGWNAVKEKYTLTEVRPGAFGYAPKESDRMLEPSHYLCANCYQERHKSIFQKQLLIPGVCDESERPTSGARGDRPRSRRVPLGSRSFECLMVVANPDSDLTHYSWGSRM
jgi:hypothetical protein